MKLRLYAISPPSTIVAVEDTLDNRTAVEAVIAANQNLILGIYRNEVFQEWEEV